MLETFSGHGQLYSIARCFLISSMLGGKDELFTERQTFTINYYLTVGSLLSLSLRLWGEEVKRKRIVYIANALLHLLLLADAGYLYLLPEDFPFLETGLAHGSALTALGLSIFTLPFFPVKKGRYCLMEFHPATGISCRYLMDNRRYHVRRSLPADSILLRFIRLGSKW